MGQFALEQRELDLSDGTGAEYGKDDRGNRIICLWAKTPFAYDGSRIKFKSGTMLTNFLKNLNQQAWSRQFERQSITDILQTVRSEHPGFSVAVCLATIDGIVLNVVIRNASA